MRVCVTVRIISLVNARVVHALFESTLPLVITAVLLVFFCLTSKQNGGNMKLGMVYLVIAAGLMVTGSTYAADMPPEGKSKCGACHAIDKKIVGPAFNDVAAKYKGDKNATSKIAASITKGGSFGWKLGVMPPKGLGATDTEIKSMAAFIAGLAK